MTVNLYLIVLVLEQKLAQSLVSTAHSLMSENKFTVKDWCYNNYTIQYYHDRGTDENFILFIRMKIGTPKLGTQGPHFHRILRILLTSTMNIELHWGVGGGDQIHGRIPKIVMKMGTWGPQNL